MAKFLVKGRQELNGAATIYLLPLAEDGTPLNAVSSAMTPPPATGGQSPVALSVPSLASIAHIPTDVVVELTVSVL